MMRYQRVIPDCLPLSNGKNSSGEHVRSIPNGLSATNTFSTNFQSKGFRFRSPSKGQDNPHNGAPSPSHSDNNYSQTQRHDTSSSPSPSRGGSGSGDMLLQWGQKKRARASRSEIRALADDSSSTGKARQPMNKVPRRVDNKLPTATMQPPPPPQDFITPNTSSTRGGFLRKESSAALSNIRNLEKRSGAGNGSPPQNYGGSYRAVSRSSAGKRSPPTPEKIDRKMSTSRFEKPHASILQSDQKKQVDLPVPQSEKEKEARATNPVSVGVGGGDVNARVIEWPRIYIGLSRKEKEDDFFTIKGTKLPQRPRKRAKNIDRTLQYCFPGMWLSELTKSRYEVREKRSVKKQKPMGLKGMESMDTDSD